MQNAFESNTRVASALTLLRQGGSQVTQGNLITLPVGGGLVYSSRSTFPVGGAGSGSYPTLQRVLVIRAASRILEKAEDALAQVLREFAGAAEQWRGTGRPPSKGTPKASAAVLALLQPGEPSTVRPSPR